MSKRFSISRLAMLSLLMCTLLDCFGQGQISRHTSRRQKTQKDNITISNPDGYINGHGYVDLGLPSKTKWAISNIGAEEPSQEGKRYSWGEIVEKSDYNETNSLTYGKTFEDIAGNPNYDVAQHLWGSQWKMPSLSDLREIESYCKWKWIKYKGSYGIRLTGPNGKSLFLPAPTIDQWNNFRGEYWLSTPIESMFGSKNTTAWSISISDGTMVKGVSNTAQGYPYRYYDLMVRPVSK